MVSGYGAEWNEFGVAYGCNLKPDSTPASCKLYCSRPSIQQAPLKERNQLLFIKVMITLLITTSVLLHLITCQIIKTTLLDGKYACPGQEVIYTCVTNGSLVIAWSNDEYIGRNGRQLELASTDAIGSRITSMINPDTFAELTMIEGGRVTESQLHIVVSPDIPTAVVTCSDVSSGTFSSIHFELLPVPGIPQDVTAYKVTPSSGDDCIIVINWKPSSNINMTLPSHYMVESPSGNFTTAKTANAVALLIHHCQIESNTSIRIYTIDYCDRHSANSDNIIMELLEVGSKSSGGITTVTYITKATPEQNGFKNGQQDSSTAAIVGGVLGGIVGISVVILIALSVAVGILSNRLVGHLPKEQLEQTLRVRIHADSENPPSARPKDTTRKEKDPDTKLRKKRYMVARSKHIDDISHEALLKDSGDEENLNIEVHPM